MQVEVTTVVDRPVAKVQRFYEFHHVQKHPHSDPDIELVHMSDGPKWLGTLIKKRFVCHEAPVEGAMEVVEFGPDRMWSVKIRDGDIETNGHVTLVAEDQDRTAVTLWADFPGMDDSMADKIASLMQRSARAIKGLIETEA